MAGLTTEDRRVDGARGIRKSRYVLLVTPVVFLALVFAAVALAATGDLTQKPGTAGCISEDGTGGACSDGVALDRVQSVTVSPDGKNAYAASSRSDALAIFDRDPTTGELTQKPGTAGCVSEDGTGGACSDGFALDNPVDVTVSPDGKNAYAASTNSDALAIFDRDPTTGELTQKPGTAGCISEDGTGGTCSDGFALDLVRSVTVSPDGMSAYSAGVASDAVAIFDRNPSTGALTQKPGTAGCISETGNGAACSDGVALDFPYSVTVSSDGKSAYAASYSSDAITIFDRDPTTGELTQKPGTAGCLSSTGTGGACTGGVALDGPVSVTVSPDSESAYAAHDVSRAVTIFDRDPTTGELTQKPGTAGCVSETGSGGACVSGIGLNGASSVAVSPDGKNTYVGSSGSISVAIFDRNDGIAPVTTIDSGPSGRTSDPSPSFAFSANEPNSTFECRLDGEVWSACSSPKDYSNLADGPHTFEVRATDTDANTGDASTRSFTVDTSVIGAKISKVRVNGPARIKKGARAVFKLKVTNSGNRAATGVRLKVKGRGVSFNTSVGKISAGKTRTVRVRLKARKPGKVTVSFKVTSQNAGGKTVKKTITVRK